MGFFFLYSFELAPLKNKNKISIKQVKGLQKNFLQHFFFCFCFFFWLFIFVLLLFGLILKYRKNKSAKGSYNIAMLLSCVLCPKAHLPRHSTLLPISQEGEVISPLISAPAWTLGYSSPNISRPMPQ